MDMRNMRGMDGRRLPPRNARGEFRRRRSGRRGDRGMPMHEDMRRDMNYTGGRGGYPMGAPDYNYDMSNQGYDGHYQQGSTYYPIQAMGTFEGYYGMPEQDYARGGRGRNRNDYGYDMRYDMRGSDYARGGRRDYGYDYGDYYGDFGEALTDEELEHFCKRLKENLNDQEKQMFSKEMISQKAKQMGREMKDFGIKELEVVTLMLLDDYKKTLGANVDLMVKLAFDWLDDKDASISGAEKLSVYYDEIVMGGEND